jgi:hypothetical protein
MRGIDCFLVAVTVVITASGCGASMTVGGTATLGSAPAMGTPVRDGALEFAVRDLVQVHHVGDTSEPGLSIRAKGVFAVVTLSVRNVGLVPRTLVDSDQVLIDSRGQRFTVSMAANIYGNLDIRSTRMDPGERLEVNLAFDVPVGTVPRSMMLRESVTSEGVIVALP